MENELIDHGKEAAAEHNLKRSPHWPAVERAFRKDHPVCACGGGKSKLQVHHALIPFHYAILMGRPDLELDERNLLTISADPDLEYHILIGHLDNYKTWNPDVLVDVRRYHGWAKDKIKADPVWLHKKSVRPKLWPDMSEKERQDLAEWMNHHLPRIEAQNKAA